MELCFIFAIGILEVVGHATTLSVFIYIALHLIKKLGPE